MKNLKFIKTLAAGVVLAMTVYLKALAGETLVFNDINYKVLIVQAIRKNGSENNIIDLKAAKNFFEAHIENSKITINIGELKAEFPDVEWNLSAIRKM